MSPCTSSYHTLLIIQEFNNILIYKKSKEKGMKNSYENVIRCYLLVIANISEICL